MCMRIRLSQLRRVIREALQEASSGMSQKANDAVGQHFLALMPEDIKALKGAAMFDLYHGPSGNEYPEGHDYSSAVRALEEWWQGVGGDVYYDSQSGQVVDSLPQGEEDPETGEWEEPWLEDYYELNRRDAARAVFGALVTDGGMNA